MGPVGHSLAALAALGALAPGLFLLALRPGLRVGLGERLGLGFRRSELGPGCLWVHGASVGEILAASRLVDRLVGSGRAVCVSAGTPTGREVMRGRRPKVPCALAPLDHPWCVGAALRRVRPRALVLVEGELWPFWIRGAHERGIPVVSVSARLSERSLRRWQLAGGLARGTARRLAAVGARSEADAERFAAFGVPQERIRVTGDLKLELPADPPALAPELAALLGSVPLLVAASTHAGEETAVLGALDAAERAGCRAALLLAPRHPERFAEAEALARAAGRRVRRRSAPGPGPLAAGEVLLLDSLGELAGCFSRAALAFVGGTLAPRGGHNVLEPVLAGCPVVVGPHTEQVAPALALLEPCDAVVRVDDAGALARACAAALADPPAARRRGARGRALLAAQGGASERSAALVEEVLAGAAGAPA